MTRYALATLLTVGLLAGAAHADEIVLNGIKLEGVRITNITEGKVYFESRRDQREIDLATITGMTFKRYPNYARSVAMIDDRPADAARELGALLGQVKDKWLKPLVRLKMSEALDADGRFAPALEAWNQAVAADRSVYFLSRVPHNLPRDAAARTAAHDAAKRLLADARADSVKRELEKLVAKLAEPVAEAPDDTGPTGEQPTHGDNGGNAGSTNGGQNTTTDRTPATPAPAPTPGSAAERFNPAKLRIINNLINSERFDNAVEQINAALAEDGAPKADLYHLRAQCEAGLGQPSAAAVSYLRVAVVYPDHPLAGDSFVKAGESFVAAKRPDLARKVWQAGLERASDRTVRAQLQERINNTPAE